MTPHLFRLLGVRYLLHQWDRAALIVASIALGVATLVSSRVINRMVETAADNTTTPLRGVADLFVTNGELGVLRRVADDVRDANIPGVVSVQPLIAERVTLPDLDGRPAVLIGAELSAQMVRPDNPLGVRVTQAIDPNRSALFGLFSRRIVLLSKPIYDDWAARRAGPDTPLMVRFGTRQIECQPAGYFEFGADSPVASLGVSVVGMELSQAAGFVRPNAAGNAPDVPDQRVNRVDVLLKPDADAAAALAAVERVVGDRAKVTTPETQGQSTREIVTGVKVGFTLCSIGAMVVGLFLVYNAMAVTVAERRHDIGVLRSVGATRTQVVAAFGSGAFVLGVVGAVLGVPVGMGLAGWAVGEFREELQSIFLTTEIVAPPPGVLTVALAVLAGAATAVFAALVPAVQAAYDDPADVVRRTPGASGWVWRWAHRAACAALVVGGVAMVLARHDLPPRVGAFGGMVAALVGLLLAAPILVSLMVRIVQPVLRQVLPIEARLAADNLTRSPGRTGVVIGALGAGVAVMVQTAGVGKSNEDPVVAWVNELVQADQFVSAADLAAATSSQAPMDQKVIAELEALPGVRRATGIRYLRPEFNGTIVFAIGIDAAAFAEETQARGPGGLPELDRFRLLPHPTENRALVSDNFAQKHGTAVGDVLTLPGPNGPVQLTVVGTVRDYSWSRGTVITDRATFSRVFADRMVDVCHVFRTIPPTADRSDPVQAYADARGLAVFHRPFVRQFLGEMIDKVYKLAYLQQVIVGVVAALGVVTALLISVLQRKRELGLLLAVGATPGQVVRTVLAEAVLMGLFGTALGLLIGVPLEWYVLKVVLFEESGFVFDVLVPWRPALGIAAGAVAVATLAGLLPALHAVKTRIPDALAYE